MTLVPQTFRGSSHRESYRAEINVFHARAIKRLLEDWAKDLSEYIILPEEDRDEEENDDIRTSAETAQENYYDLFPDRVEFGDLESFETYYQEHTLQNAQNLDAFTKDLQQEVLERLTAASVDYQSRTKVVSAQDLGEFQYQTSSFSERGGLASVVKWIQNGIHSPFLTQGLELADLPGLNDRNRYIVRNSLEYFERCSHVVVVGNLERALSRSDLNDNLELAIRKKKIENVCLILRGKEVCMTVTCSNTLKSI